MYILKGVPASQGLAEGKAYLYLPKELSYARRIVEDPELELQRFERALIIATDELDLNIQLTEKRVGSEEAAIFYAHKMFLEDEELLGTVKESLINHRINIEAAWMDAIGKYESQLAALEDEYLSARAADVHDVGKRVLRCLAGLPEVDLSNIEQSSIIVAEDLAPSDTVKLNKNHTVAICTALGGPTSHTAILAKSLGIPAIVGLGVKVLEIQPGAPILVDGDQGVVTINPDAETLADFRRVQSDHSIAIKGRLGSAQEPATTKDGVTCEIVANVGSVRDAEMALQYGAEGIGLLRTEFLYLNRQKDPSEEEQLAVYQSILNVMGKRPVVVRTLDVGGDKNLPYIDLGKEENPFLGWRAIRMCLDKPDFFKVQLRSLLRASSGHDLRIMFPMIATIDEVRRAKSLLNDSRQELVRSGYPLAEKIQVGIMVEIPAVTILANQFAKEVDFFSVGTNDLTQYTMAADRDNPKVSHLGDACHPAVLTQIKHVIECGHAHGIWIGVCGELAGDPVAVPILLGLGLDEFSAAPGSIPSIKSIIRSWTFHAAQQLAQQALELDSASSVRDLVRNTHAA